VMGDPALLLGAAEAYPDEIGSRLAGFLANSLKFDIGLFAERKSI